jgi:hypothetical protein
VLFVDLLRRLYRSCSRGVYIWYMICCSRGVYIRHMMICFLGVYTEAALEASIYGIYVALEECMYAFLASLWTLTEDVLGSSIYVM